jgi:HEAT repeat protein
MLDRVRGDDEDDDAAGVSLGHLAADEGWDLPHDVRAVLVESLRSEDPSVRHDAVEMLNHSIDDELASMALELVRSDPEEEIRAAAATALAGALAAASAATRNAAIVSPISSQTFADLRQGLHHVYLDGASPKEVRRRALETAVQAPESWQEGATRAAWESADPEWRTNAVFCMARLAACVNDLVEALRDREPQVRLEAARAAGDAGLRTAAPRLLALAQADDEEGIVRMAAMESLGLLGDREAIGPLRVLAGHPDPELAFAARSALGRIAGAEPDESDGDD